VIIKADLDGTEREFEVLGRRSRGATHLLGHNGLSEWDHTPSGDDIFLRLISQRHTFGGVVYEETGVRQAAPGEWFLDHVGDGSSVRKPSINPTRFTHQEWPILRPVALEE